MRNGKSENLIKMSAIKKDFIKHLKVLQDKRKDVIESLTKICATNEQHAQVLVETIFEEFKEVFHHLNPMNNLRPE